MSEELRWLVSSGIALVVVTLVLFLFNLIRTPVFLKFEKQINPRLKIKRFVKQRTAMGSLGSEWGLEITNIGIDPAEECHGRLEKITRESSPNTLSGQPVNRDFHWAGQGEGLHEFKIPGKQSALLGIVYYCSDGLGETTLAYRGSQEFRLDHTLSVIDEPILLLVSIASKGTLPQYVVCRIDIPALVRDLVFEAEPSCTIKWMGMERRDLSDFVQVTREVSS